MPRKIRAYNCEDCGKWTVRVRLSVEPYICVECGKDRRALARHPIRRPDPPPADPPASCAR